jgi:hypothetical protein
MASTTDPRASGFDSAVFRDAIRFAMNMGLPDSTEERITFRWTTAKTFTTADSAGKPYRWNDTPSKTVAKDDVQVPAAIEFQSAGVGGTSRTVFGEIQNSKVKVTLLDEDYALVEGADLIILDGAKYIIDFVKPPDGLFDATIYTIFATAEDEA